MIKVTYELSQLGQKADLLAGGSGQQNHAFLIGPDDPNFREAVALATIASDGTGYIFRPYDVPIAYDEPPTAVRVLADIREYLGKQKEKEEAEHEAKIQRILTEPLEAFLVEWGDERWQVAAILQDEEDPRVADLRAIARAAAVAKTREAREAKEARAKALAMAEVLLAKELAALDQAKALLKEVWQAVPDEADEADAEGDWEDAVPYSVRLQGAFLKRLRAFIF